ncbi:MAG: hypothetical protein NTV24_02370 [Candidatus Woesebacteria bacterium]|nr:hypothetical protein [Candidatus Woesebacteria bacterium]
MNNLSNFRRRVLRDFLTTIASGWFVAGVVSTVFVHPGSIVDVIFNVIIGTVLAYLSLQMAFSLEEKNK